MASGRADHPADFLLTTASGLGGGGGVLPLVRRMAGLSWARRSTFRRLLCSRPCTGMNTTGSTVFTGLDDLPKGLLLWRAILQWLVSIGIHV